MADKQRLLLKYLSLVVLSVQTAAHVLTLRYSRKPGQPPYLSSSVVAVCEMVKLVVCTLVIFLSEGGSFSKTAVLLYSEVFKKPKEMVKLAVPAAMYTVQNNLLFVALSNLDAATYQVTYQLKILTTAIFSVFILRKKLGITQWFALVILTAGVALVQVAQVAAPSPGDEAKRGGAGAAAQAWSSSHVAGLAAVLCACVSSGFSGVYFEKVLKGSSASLWIRNVQLAIPSIGFGLINVAISDWQQVSSNGLFQGYNHLVWAVILLQALGGLVVALVVKYADNILKGFAVSFSILISTFISYQWLGDIQPSSTFFLGSALVIAATFVYGIERKDSKTSS